MERPKIENIFMNFARDLAKRGTCSQLSPEGKPRRAGAVITTGDFKNILSIGYNGNYKGGKNTCDNPDAQGEARCGCIHAEMNALVKCDNWIQDKCLFITSIPCLLCTKLIVNSGFSRVYVFLDKYSEKRSDGKDYAENLNLMKSVGIRIFMQKALEQEFEEFLV